MSYEDFCYNFITYREEFWLGYKDKLISIINNPNNENGGFVCIVSYDISNKNILYQLLHNNDYICMEFFSSPIELINNFKYEGRTLKEMWDEIDS